MFHYQLVQRNNNHKTGRCLTTANVTDVYGSSHRSLNLWTWRRCTKNRWRSPQHMKFPFGESNIWEIPGKWMYREAGVQETFHHPPSEMWQPSSHQVVWHHAKQTPCSWRSEDNAIAKNIKPLCASERCTQCTPRDVLNKFIHEENRFLHSRINSFPNCVRKGTGEE